MDLGTRHNEQAGRYDGLSAGELYGEIRGTLSLMQQAQIDQYLAILAWADQHTVDDETVAATAWAGFCDTGLPIAGAGTPLVSEFAAMELIGVLGRSPESGRSYLGQCLELAWRLPSCHAQVLAGNVKLYKALEVADHTRSLSAEAAGFVDRHLAFALPTCTLGTDRPPHHRSHPPVRPRPRRAAAPSSPGAAALRHRRHPTR